MSRQIDLSKPLSAEDADYLRQRGRHGEIAAAGLASEVETPSEEDQGGEDTGPVDPSSGDGNDGDNEDQGGETPSELDDLTVLELQALLKAKGLPTTGNKSELIARLSGD